MEIDDTENGFSFDLYDNLLCIKFPGIVDNPDKAIEAIGGLANLTQWYNQADRSLLPLKLDRNDHAKRGSFGRITPPDNRRMLIKLTPRVKRVTYSDGTTEDIQMEPKVEVLGVISDYVVFDLPIDYQYKPRLKTPDNGFVTNSPLESFTVQKFYDSIKNTNHIDLSALDSSELLKTLDFAPQSLAVKIDPKNYRWVFNRKKNSDENDSAFTHTFKSDSTITHWDGTAPMNHGIRKDDEAVFVALCHLFATRPCWTRRELLWQLEADFGIKFPSSAAKRCLPYIAYNFTDGPFRNVLCRWHYDPRKDPAARFFQITDFRGRGIKKANDLITSMAAMSTGRASSRHGDKGSEIKEKECPTFRDSNNRIVVPVFVTDTENVSGVSKTHFQSITSVVDITERRVHDLLQFSSGTYSDKNGWLSGHVISKIRLIVREKVEHIAHLINISGNEMLDSMNNSYASIDPNPAEFWNATSFLNREDLIADADRNAKDTFQSILERSQPMRKRKGRVNYTNS